MVTSCCVIGCSNKATKDSGKCFFRLPEIITHQGPRAEESTRNRQAKGLCNISRADFVHPTSVCSDHFLSGKYYYIYFST